MKKYFLLLFIGLATQVFSQNKDDVFTPNFPKETLNPPVILSSNQLHMISKYRKTQTAGALALSGGLLAAGGGLLLINSVSSSPDIATVVFGTLLGVVITAVGTAGTITGCVFLIKGSVRKHQAKQLSISALPIGARIAFTF